MHISSAKIEELATTAVQAEIGHCNALIAKLSTMDKEPVWDGYIYVYKSDLPCSNDNLRGKIPVQIKGKLVATFSDKYCKFIVNRSSFVCFQADFGVLFFVIEILKSTQETKIFCETLLPYDLGRLLADIPVAQKTKTISIPELITTKTSSLYFKCINFLNDRKKQRGSKILKLEDIEGVIGLGISVTSKPHQHIEYMLENPIYTYARISNEIDIPISKDFVVGATVKVNCNISVNGTVYYNTFLVKYAKQNSKKSYHFGKGIEFYFENNKIQYHLSGSLNERLLDLNFLIALLNSEGFNVDDKFFKLSTLDLRPGTQKFNSLVGAKNDLDDLSDLLAFLNITFDADLDELNENDIDIINILIDHIIKGNRDKKFFYKTGYCFIELFEKKILLFSVESSLYNYFSRDFFSSITVTIDKLPQNVISPYCMLNHDMLLKADNFDKQIVLESIEEYSISDNTQGAYIQLLLETLKAIDTAPERNDLKEFAEILSSILIEFVNSDINILNFLQLKKRTRKLTPQENEKLKKILNDTINDEIACGALILLEDKEKFQKKFELLNEEEQQTFRSYPIFSLTKCWTQ